MLVVRLSGTGWVALPRWVTGMLVVYGVHTLRNVLCSGCRIHMSYTSVEVTISSPSADWKSELVATQFQSVNCRDSAVGVGLVGVKVTAG